MASKKKLKRRIRKLEDKIEWYEDENTSLIHQIMALGDEISGLRKEADTYRKVLTDRAVTEVIRNASSFFGPLLTNFLGAKNDDRTNN